MRSAAIAAPLLLATGIGAFVIAAPDTDWNETELALARSLSLDNLPPLPPDPSSRVADDPAAAELGRAIFSDTRFSANGEVSCATCHLPERQFQDDLPLARGVGQTHRRTMPLAGAAHAPFLFWDGRADSLWAQALGPLESAVEHGGDRTGYVHLVAEHYRADYEAIFGSLPDMRAWPRSAGPVAGPEERAQWEAMAEADRHAVNVVFSNIGKAIAAFERTIEPMGTRFDAWLASPDFPAPGLLNEEEIEGFRLFLGEAQCINCHNGPLLTDNHFHNTGVPAAPGLPEDSGRGPALRIVLDDPFNCLGTFSDAEPEECAELRFMAREGHDMLRAYKTPSLRGVGSRPPYMHAGQIDDLREVVAHYIAAPEAPFGHSELQALELDEEAAARIVSFLHTLE